jgi:hypothetical protein
MTYAEQLQRIVRGYREAGMPWPAAMREVAAWAITAKQWAPQPSDMIQQCADELSAAMRQEHITDAQGRHVRAKHAARMKRNGEQVTLWADIRTASVDHMSVAFQQRRQQIVGECKQLKADVDSFNQNTNKGPPVQLVLDFTLDVEESERAIAAA